MNQVQLTPEQSIKILRDFVSHPQIRCFNVAEFQTAFNAISVLEAEIQPETVPANVVPLDAEASPK